MSDTLTTVASWSVSADMASSMRPTPSSESAFFNKLPRELRNNIYSSLIPAKLEVEVYSKRRLEVGSEMKNPIEAVNLEEWHQLTNTQRVCKQLKTELDEEITVAKKTKACKLCLHMKAPAPPTSLEAEQQQQRNERALDGFSKIIVTMPFVNTCSFGTCDLWVGRFTYLKGLKDVWSLDAGEGYLLEGFSHPTKYTAELRAVMDKVGQNIAEDGERGMAQVIEALKGRFEWEIILDPAESMHLLSSTLGIGIVTEWFSDHSDWSGMKLIRLTQGDDID